MILEDGGNWNNYIFCETNNYVGGDSNIVNMKLTSQVPKITYYSQRNV